MSKDLREAIKTEWKLIKTEKDKHQIFWKFLREERNNIIHEYQWNTYRVWMNEQSEIAEKKLSLLTIDQEYHRATLVMSWGEFAGRNSLELLEEGCEWVRDRIYTAIDRAGLSPD